MTTLPEFLTPKQLSEWMGWSLTTIWRKQKQGAFPIYKFSRSDVRYKREEVLYFIEGKREGGFNV